MDSFDEEYHSLADQKDDLFKGDIIPLPQDHPLDKSQVDANDKMLKRNMDPTSCSEEELIHNHFQYIKGPPGSGKTLTCAYALLRLHSRLQHLKRERASKYLEVCKAKEENVKMGELEAAAPERLELAMSDEELNKDWCKSKQYDSSAVYFVASNNQTIFNMHWNLKKLGVDFVVIKTHFKTNADVQMYSGMDNYAISAEEACRRASNGTLSKIIMITFGQLSHPKTKIASICKPSLLMIDDASNFFRKDMPTLMEICCTGKLVRTIIVGDNTQLKPFEDVESPNVESLLNVYIKDPIVLEKSYRLMAPAEEIITRGNYFSAPDLEVSTTSSAAIEKAKSPPFCLFVDCDAIDRNIDGELFKKPEREGSSKRQRFNNGSRHANGTVAPPLGDQMSEMSAAAKLIKIYRDRGFSLTVLTMYERHRKSLSEYCLKLRYPHDFCYNKIYTVDSFQGSQDDYIILLVGCNDRPGFVGDECRQKAALSRNKKHLTILSHQSAMEDPDMFKGELLSQFCLHKDTQKITGTELKKANPSTVLNLVCPRL